MSYFKRLIEKSKAELSKEELEAIKKKLLMYGGILLGCGIVLSIIGFYFFMINPFLMGSGIIFLGNKDKILANETTYSAISGVVGFLILAGGLTCIVLGSINLKNGFILENRIKSNHSDKKN